MALPLMPKATAVWLIENTTLTFEQIATFCGMHALEIQAIADGEVAPGMIGLDPVANGQLSQAEINRCLADPSARLRLLIPDLPQPVPRSKGPRYTPVTKRGDKPDAIAWALKTHPELSEAQICRLIGTTKPTIQAVRDKTHWNSPNIKPRHPVSLGLCTQRELDDAVTLAARNAAARGDHPPVNAVEPGDNPEDDQDDDQDWRGRGHPDHREDDHADNRPDTRDLADGDDDAGDDDEGGDTGDDSEGDSGD